MCRLGSLVTEQSSFAAPELAQATHYDLAYTVDFAARVLRGTVRVTVQKNAAAATEVVLDTHHLALTALPEGATLDAAVAPFGQALRVPLPAALAVGETTVVAIGFETTAAGGALQFLAPEQTAGKAHPYLFSQCQAIHARSMLPCQDAPGVKATYSAAVTVPAPLVALMSALPDGAPAVDAAAGTATYRFTQAVPIASYLIALAVGNIDSREVGPRSRVYAEPEVVDAAAYEFAQTEAMIVAAERLLGPYVWGEYNILCLPPSFPYGGMENPCLTFVTPSLIAGDRSLADVIAHELAHSWSGNLVTNQTANAFFLNEGFTMFIERKILAALHGGRAAFHLSALAGVHALESCVAQFQARGEAEFTKLVPDLEGIDPDDAFSSVPYEKGFSLLFHIECIVSEAKFEAFLHDYFQTFKYCALTANDFKAYVLAYFGEGRFALPRVGHTGVPPRHGGPLGPQHDPREIPALTRLNSGDAAVPGAEPEGEGAAAALSAAAAAGIDLSTAVDWDAWFYAPGGVPVARLPFDDSERRAVDEHAAAWVADPASAAAHGPAATAAWRSPQWIAFAQALAAQSAALLARGATLHPRVLTALDAAYGLSRMRNAEVRSQWAALALRSALPGAVAGALDFLQEFGRMKYVRPLYCELMRCTQGRPAALALFPAHRRALHPICAKMVASDLDKEAAVAPRDPAAVPTVPAAWAEGGEAAPAVEEQGRLRFARLPGRRHLVEAEVAPGDEEAAGKEAEVGSDEADAEAAAGAAPLAGSQQGVAAADEAAPAQAAAAAVVVAAAATVAVAAVAPASESASTDNEAASSAAGAGASDGAGEPPAGAVQQVEEEAETGGDDEQHGNVDGAKEEEEGDEGEEGDDEGEGEGEGEEAEDDEEEEEEEEAAAPVKRVRFGQKAAGGSRDRKRVTFSADTAASPPASPSTLAPYPPPSSAGGVLELGASTPAAAGSSSSTSGGSAPPLTVVTAAPAAPAPASTASASSSFSAAVRAASSTSSSSALSAAVVPPLDPKVAAAREELAQVKALRAANPGMSALAAARQVKGLPPRASAASRKGGAAGGGGGGEEEEEEAGGSGSGGAPRGGALAWLSAATATALETPVVSVATAEVLSSGLALLAVGGALAATVWLATRR